MGRSQRRCRGWLLAGTLVLTVRHAAPATPAGSQGTLDAAAIVRRAEQARAPQGRYAVDFTIRVDDDRANRTLRTASYAMLVDGSDRAVVLMLSPRAFFGGCLLIVSGAYWLLLPASEQPLELAGDQVLRGDVASGDLARSNLLSEYRPRLEGEESVDGEACFRVELVREAERARYSRIVSWISKKELLPRKIEFYGRTKALLRTARYREFLRTSVGVFPAKIEIMSGVDPHQRTTLRFSRVRAIDPSSLPFTPAGLVSFRRAALELAGADGAPPSLEDVLARLRRSGN